ncbi:MAG: metallophosphoesterase [Candidatus Bathyarchaeota archaeon]|nr:MAG: metallophosphoesterase [Candidatus Bathyarchaeota archaeon]
MIVGVMADTHDHLLLVDKAVRRLNKEGIELVIHAGDYVAGFVIPHLTSLKANLLGILGNNDGDHEVLREKFEEAGFDLCGTFAETKADGLRIAVVHGKDVARLHSLINAANYDVVVHGHTHQATVHREGRLLIVNPGEVCGYLTGKSTIAILNTETRDAHVVSLG